jgi:3-deoxy-D-manno-octulosonic-acid transferase
VRVSAAAGPARSGVGSPRWARTLPGVAYRALAATAAAAARLVHRLSPDPASRSDLGERLAVPESLDGLPQGAIWAHAASMGEVRALAALLRALRDAGESRAVVVTTQSATGRRLARELGFASRLAPADHPAVLARFLEALEPPLHLVVETEIWPWRLSQLRRRGVPTAIVSARLSPRRWPRYRRLRSLYGAALAEAALVCPASESDRTRFVALGVPEALLGTIGNLKWDAAPAAPERLAVEALRAELGLDPAWHWIVLGSCHPGEAIPFAPLALGPERGALLVAPRHPERFQELASELSAAGLSVHRASQGGAPVGTRAVLLDRMGVLLRAYPLAAAATLGGTFAPVGGHSPLEAAAAGCPLVAGPHDHAQHDLVEPLAAAGALVRCAGPESALAQLRAWLDDPAARLAAGAAARREVESRRGVARQLAEAVRGLGA